jgi:hypothetical protein
MSDYKDKDYDDYFDYLKLLIYYSENIDNDNLHIKYIIEYDYQYSQNIRLTSTIMCNHVYSTLKDNFDCDVLPFVFDEWKIEYRKLKIKSLLEDENL